MSDRAFQERHGTAVISALSMAATNGNLGDALPEGTVPIINVVGLPNIFEKLVSLEETLFIEQGNSQAASLQKGGQDLFRFFSASQLVPASRGEPATVTITGGELSHERSVMNRLGQMSTIPEGGQRTSRSGWVETVDNYLNPVNH